MTEIWQYVIGFWLAGAILAMWKIYLPSLKVIKLVAPNTILVTRPILSGLVTFILFIIFLPFMILPLLIPERLETFAQGFIKGAADLKDNTK